MPTQGKGNSVKAGIRHVPSIPVQLPEQMVMTRLGFSRSRTRLTEKQKSKLQDNMSTAFALCRPQGVWTRRVITDRSERQVVLENGSVLASRNLSEMLKDSSSVLLMATTVGHEIMDAIAKLIEHDKDAATALVFDAVGGQTADAALDWLNQYLKQQFFRRRENLTHMRYSPGYGDLDLANQKLIFEILKLDRLGLTITDRFLLVPEKSVIGICGIRNME